MSLHLSPAVKAQRSNHGANFSVQRVDMAALEGFAQPIVGFDHFQIVGPTFAPHPHAGFSAVSYVFDDSPGSLRNRDSLGNDVLIEPGDLLWTQAGSGMIHDEFPAKRGTLVHGLQLFVNLSSRNKLLPPQMLHARRRDIPAYVDEHGNRTKVLTGRFESAISRTEPAEPFDFFDLNLSGRWSWQIAPGRSVMVYVIKGQVTVAASESGTAATATRELGRHEAVGLRNGGELADLWIEPMETAQVLVLSGLDPKESSAVYGPFIMNTQIELEQAFERYRSGQMGRLAPLPQS